MMERVILEYLTRKKGINEEELKKILKEKPEDEDTLSFLLKLGLLSYEDLNAVAKFKASQHFTDKKILQKHGINFEDSYLIYTKRDDTLYVIPYFHIKAVELRKNTVNIYVGGIEKIRVDLENETLAKAFLDILLVHVDKIFLKREMD